MWYAASYRTRNDYKHTSYVFFHSENVGISIDDATTVDIKMVDVNNIFLFYEKTIDYCRIPSGINEA